MNYFLNLPTELLVFELFPLLSLTECCHLDVAITNQHLRPQLFELYPFLSLQHSKAGISPCQLKWFLKRSISLTSITFVMFLMTQQITDIFNQLKKFGKAEKVKHLQCYEHMIPYHYTLLRTCCTGLLSLDLSGCSKLTKPMLTELAKGCPDICSLRLLNTRITSAGVLTLAQKFPALTELDLGYSRSITNAAVIAVAENCSALISLNLKYCDKVSDGVLRHLAQNCTMLTTLDLVGMAVSEDAMRLLATSCSSLRSISVGHFTITDLCVVAIAKKLPLLSALCLVSNCINLSDAAVISVTHNCHALSALDVSGVCLRLTDIAVMAVARHCQALTTLNMSGCKEITDVAFIPVTQNCPVLTKVNVSWCSMLTDASIDALAQNCSALSDLDIAHCIRLTERSLESLYRDAGALINLRIGTGQPSFVRLFENARIIFARGGKHFKTRVHDGGGGGGRRFH